MSKLDKLINTPGLFFKDMILKRIGRKKLADKKTSTVAKDAYQFNPFERYTHLLHTGENVTGLSHLDLWIPHFLAADINFVVMVRNQELFNLVKEKYPHITVLYAKGNTEVAFYLKRMAYLKACFYPSNTGNNLHLLQFNELRHIFIGHGDSDKTASAHKYFRVYDENWVAGEAHIDRFRNAGFDFTGLKQVKVGRPNLKEILQLSDILWRERFDGKLNLLYLSTWEGFVEEQNYTSAYFMEDFFENEKIFDKIDIKVHPKLGQRDTSLLEFTNNVTSGTNENQFLYSVHSKDMPVSKLIQESNIFICDISAVVTECLAANAPTFVYIPQDKEIKLSQSKMSYEDYTYTFSSIDELIEKIETVLEGNDYLSEKREEAMEYILGKEETLKDEFVQQLQSKG